MSQSFKAGQPKSEPQKSELLETKVAFLEDNLATLSEEFFAQQKELEVIKSQLAMLVGKLRGLQESTDNNSQVIDEKPPHY